MSPDAWARIAEVPPAALADPTLELHWAVQVLAAAGHTFVAPRADDSHRAVRWDAATASFVGEAFTEGYPFRVALAVEALTLRLLDRTGSALGELPLGGVTLEDGFVWLRAGLSQYMGGTGPEILRPDDFAPPAHRVGEGAPFAVDREVERATLAALYGSAAEVLAQTSGAHRGQAGVPAGRDAPAVRCWPHHFDLAVLTTVRPPRSGAPAQSVGAGLGPRGGSGEGWYWYVTPQPAPPADRLPPLTPPARRHTRGWTGAELRGEDVLSAPASERRALVEAFLDEGRAAARTALLNG